MAHDHVALPALAMRDQQRLVDELFAQLPVAQHQRQVILFDDTLAEFLVQRPQRAALLGKHQAARRLAVEPVHQRQVPEVGTRRPEQFDDAMADTAAAVDGDARRLVDDQQALVLVKHVIQDGGRAAGGRRGALGAQAHRRDTNLVAGFETVSGPHPPAIDPHFATPQQPVDPAARHAGQLAVQKVIHTLARPVRVNAYLSYAAGAAAGPLHRLFLHDQ